MERSRKYFGGLSLSTSVVVKIVSLIGLDLWVGNR